MANEWQVEEAQSMIAALTADYLNVYVIEPKADRGTILKLDGYVINGIKETPKDFTYSKVLRTYANDRVCDEDREEFLRMVLPDALVAAFENGREKLELKYRVPIAGKLEHYSGLYIRISKLQENLKLIAGFRCTEDVISVQKKTRDEGLYSAYAAVSDLYLAMFRVNIKNNTYSSIKTTDAVLKYTLSGSNKYDENLKAVITELADEDSRDLALDFLKPDTIEERMRDKNHISVRFNGKVAGACKIHLIKEDTDADGSLRHVILAVEVLEDGEYLPVFDVLARGFQNVFLIDTEDGTAKILKLDGYITSGINKDHRYFDYPVILKEYVEKNVHPDDKKRVADTLNIRHLKQIFAIQDECVGTYRNIEDGVQHYYQYDFRRIGDTDKLVAGFRLIDGIIREQEAQQKRERELEEAHLNDVREHAEVISSLSTIYSTIFRAELDTHHYDVLNSVALMGTVAGGGGNFDDVKEDIIHAFMAPEMRDPMREFLNLDTLADRLRDVNTVVTEYKNPVGRWFQARFIVKRRDAAGVTREVLYVARDFTDEKEKEIRQQKQLSEALTAARQANKAKSTFLNSMSHDIRTPMNAIIGFTSLAQTHIENQTQVQDYLAKISTSSTHLLNLINDILDMSRIESGTVKLEEKPVHIPDLLQDLRTMVQGLVNSKNLNLRIDTKDLLHEDAVTDKLRLNQILINIVGNAIKFTNPGGDVEICLTEKPCRSPDYSTYEFAVKDNGIGMSKEFIGHIFDTFSREYSSTVSGIQGTGLGMAITKNIVDMMGGTIAVESEEGKGSVFTVTLNLRTVSGKETKESISQSSNQTESDQPSAETATAKKKTYDYSGKHVLLVEDNELNREIATAILEEAGMTIDSVNDGDVAVSTINGAPADKYDLILMDIQMPKMDGYAATKEIRTLPDNKKANIPIVAMTANAFEEDRQKAYASGMNGHIIKPISMEQIAKVLDRIFTEKNS